MLCETPTPSRRALLAGSGALFAWAYLPRIASASGGRDPRLVTLVLHGALDGLSAAPPLGDPTYAELREGIALSRTGERPAHDLDGFFALHPAMPNLARLYRAGQASVIHAVATPYRERSHFDGQDVLESGLGGVSRVESGWLNRLIATLPRGERVRPPGGKDPVLGLGVGAVAPLIVRGPAPVLGWAPPVLQKAAPDTAERLLALYAARDPMLEGALRAGLDTDRLATGGAELRNRGSSDNADQMETIATGAARLLAREDGPRVAAMVFDGWDTHANEGGASGRLAYLLGGLDRAIAAIERTMGDAWRETIVAVVTEFGRTARVNGTVGTDHGTATVALLAGGAVKGGRVIADWPGLRPSDLQDGRDLKPTLDLRAVMKGLARDHLGAPESLLGDVVFPGTAALRPLDGLVA